MKQHLHNSLMLLVFLLAAVSANAYDFIVDGIAYKFIYDDGGHESTSCSVTTGDNPYSGDIVIPSTVVYNGVTYTVTEIEYIGNCDALKTITIPYSVTNIEEDFVSCPSLKGINVDSGNSHYASKDGVLFNKNLSTLITCPEGKSGDYSIPQGVTTIEEGAFGDCSALTNITIPNSVSEIGESAFDGCSSLTEITIPEKVTSLGYGTFDRCSSLKEVNLPQSLTFMAEECFKECIALENITIPEKVTGIEQEIFDGCSSLKNVIIPNSVTYIDNSAFSGCSALEGISIPNSVTRIGSWCFEECNSLKSITIPLSVQIIGYNSFLDCENLKEINCLNTTPPKLDNEEYTHFEPDITFTNATVYVPKGSVESYKTTLPWSKYEKIEGRDFAGISYLQASDLSVSTEDGNLIVNGANGVGLNVYDLNGCKVYANDQYEGENIQLPRGTYIVKAGDRSLKVNM